MLLSSDLCHAQALAQQDRATNHPLPHVRQLAEKAAAAWRIEGHWAEKREQRRDPAEGSVVDCAQDFSGPDPDDYIPRAKA